MPGWGARAVLERVKTSVPMAHLSRNKGVGWCVGFLVGWVLERRYVGFSTDVPMMTRLTVGLLGYYVVSLILASLLKSWIPGLPSAILSSFLQMFYVSFVFPLCMTHFVSMRG